MSIFYTLSQYFLLLIAISARR